MEIATGYSYPNSALSQINVCALSQSALCALFPATVTVAPVFVPSWHVMSLSPTVPMDTEESDPFSCHADDYLDTTSVT